MDELEKALAEDDVGIGVMSAPLETGLPPEEPQFFYRLTIQAAEKIGLDPNTLV